MTQIKPECANPANLWVGEALIYNGTLAPAAASTGVLVAAAAVFSRNTVFDAHLGRVVPQDLRSPVSTLCVLGSFNQVREGGHEPGEPNQHDPQPRGEWQEDGKELLLTDRQRLPHDHVEALVLHGLQVSEKGQFSSITNMDIATIAYRRLKYSGTSDNKVTQKRRIR